MSRLSSSKFPLFSIHPTFLENVKPFVDKATAEKKEVVLALDFDDTIIKYQETNFRKKPVINEALIVFLTNLFAQHPAAQFKIMILSSRVPDDEMRPFVDSSLLVGSALPIFLKILNDQLERRLLSDKKMLSIEEKHVYCIRGNKGFVRRTYSSEDGLKSVESYYWLCDFPDPSDQALHRALIPKGIFTNGEKITFKDMVIYEKGPFLSQILKKSDYAYCLHVDDSLLQIENVYKHVKDFVMPVMVATRPDPRSQLVGMLEAAIKQKPGNSIRLFSEIVRSISPGTVGPKNIYDVTALSRFK